MFCAIHLIVRLWGEKWVVRCMLRAYHLPVVWHLWLRLVFAGDMQRWVYVKPLTHLFRDGHVHVVKELPGLVDECMQVVGIVFEEG